MLSYLCWSSPRESLRRFRWFRRVASHTKVSRERLSRLCDLAQCVESDGVAGAIVECGVFKGGAAAVMAASAPGREVFLFDSFEGLPPPGVLDGEQARAGYQKGWCAASESDVREVFERLGVLGPRVHLVKGWFQDTFPVTMTGPIALLHVDADWYESVRTCLERFWNDVQPGGYVAFDDYGRWEGCTRAVDEFLRLHHLEPLQPTGRSGHYLRKR